MQMFWKVYKNGNISWGTISPQKDIKYQVHILKQNVCGCVKGGCSYMHERSKRTREEESQPDMPVRLEAQPDSEHKYFTDICSVLFPNGTDSNNCEHLGNLQALHTRPWGSSPGTGGSVWLPFLHKSSLEQGDYHSSAQRDKKTGILSNYFTLIIRTRWQCGTNADIIKVPQTPAAESKSQLFKVTVKIG